jgi:phosphoglycerate dehydrogenase-like enzyme
VVVVGDDTRRAAWLQAGVPGVRIVGVRDNDAAAAELADADGGVFVECNSAAVRASTTLEWVHTPSGGSDSCLANPRVANGSIMISNSRKVKNARLSEAAMQFVLALAGSLDVALQNMPHGDFHAVNGRRQMQLEDSTMLVVGLGGSGTEVARMAHAMGMHVVGTRGSTRGDKPDFLDYVGLADETARLAAQADVIVIGAPLTPQTRNLFNAAMFAHLKRGVMVVDYTRPEIINARDLVAALKSGQVGSAGINWADIPPPATDDPIWHAPNLILTGAHATAAAARLDAAVLPAGRILAPGDITGDDEDNELRWILVRENIRRFASGDRMYSVFDLARGY